MRLLVLCSIFCLSVLSAEIPSYSELLKAPKGLAKDYYIYRYASEKNPNKAELKELQKLIFRNSGKIKKLFESKVGVLKLPPECEGDIYAASPACQKDLLSKQYLESLSKEQRERLAQYFKGRDNDLYTLSMAINSPDPLGYINASGNIWAYYRYLGASVNLANELRKIRPSRAMWTSLSKSNRFLNLLSEAVVKGENAALKSWLLELNPSEPQGMAAFWAGLNALLSGDEKKAELFFEQAAKTPASASGRDQAFFWHYLLTKSQTSLKTLSNSKDINMYSLYAKEITGNNKLEVIVPQPVQVGLKGYDISDPFTWQRTKDEAAKLKGKELANYALKFYTKTTQGEFSYLMQRAYKGARHYFPTPFMEFIGTNDISRQALILAIARQESRFVPSAVSVSYALGMMQFMPFVANDIGKKKLGIPGFKEDDMFKPRVAYEFANYHLNYLEKYLKNPIFVAYAYNGGLGFTRRMITGGKLFNANTSKYTRFEPFISMELVPYAESREYAKKVLANYVIYSSILGSNIKISKFFEKLAIPGGAESFR